MNKQDKSLIKELCEMEISNLPDREFKIIVINKPVELRKESTQWELQQASTKEIENVKKTKSELNNTISKWKQD